MILGPDGAKLSKRHGAVSVLQYEEEGYVPDALLNYLVRLGWSHGDQPTGAAGVLQTWVVFVHRMVLPGLTIPRWVRSFPRLRVGP
jgi:hypothetical protein